MSQLGFGLPYALALQLQHPERLVSTSPATARSASRCKSSTRHAAPGLPVITLIHNNAAWGIIRAGQKRQFDFELGTNLADSDYAAIARGFGCHGETVTRVEDVAPAIARALASGLPSVLDCHTRFVPHPCMPSFGSMNQFGFDALTRTNPPGLESPATPEGAPSRMNILTLEQAHRIITAALANARSAGYKPMGIAVSTKPAI